MGKLIGLLKDVIVDSTQNRSQGQQGKQGQQGRFNNSDFYGSPRQDRNNGYSRGDDYYRDANQQNFDGQGSRPVYTMGDYGRRQRGNSTKAPSPPAYLPSYRDGTSLADSRSFEDGGIQQDYRIPGPAIQVTDRIPFESRLGSLPQNSHSVTYPPQPQGRDDVAPLAELGSNYASSYEGYRPENRGLPYADEFSDSPNYSLRAPGARTLRGVAPQRQYESESFIDQGYSSDPQYESRGDRRRARRSDRRASKSTNRQGIVSLLKDSIVSSANSRSSGGR